MPITPKNSIAKKETTQLHVATPANIRVAMASKGMQSQLQAMISDPKRRDSMVSSMVGMVQQNPGLQECEVSTVYNAAIAGEALRLPYGFGYWYAVPRANNKKGKTFGLANGKYKEATFQMGYKGFVQLAMRAGEYKDIDVFEIKEGELKNPNRRRKTVDDFIYLEKHDELKTIGYFAFFELQNGFTKGIYMTRKRIVAHATEYSYFKNDIYEKLQRGERFADAWKYSSQWYTDFDMMAEKTVLKQLLSKWGILSVEMQSAIKTDQAIVDEQGKAVSYPENPKSPENKENVIDGEAEDVTPEPKKEQENHAVDAARYAQQTSSKPDVNDMFKKNK